ncbi:hypothetical protein ACJ73_08339 [Blastomyces percursus]|uniref:Uncharacterized protein n=1 Tax=Blastomyces percursus TaxID=1658174 RepID=A0A1J9QYD2_9EURO|nr:hypothetical protein ACJ73_08339 [Blastomyces percursus]
MACLSQDDCDVINDHPLGDCLERLQKSLQDVERSYSIVSSLDEADDRSEKLQDVSSLKDQQSRRGLRVSKLLRTYSTGRLQLHLLPFARELIIEKATDHDIWSAILDLITKLSRVTPIPPTTVNPAFDSTPVTHSSASHQGREQTRRLVEARIFEEIRSCTYRDVQGFFEKYLEEKNWTGRARNVYESIKDQYVDCEWVGLRGVPPRPSAELAFRLQSDFLSKERRHYYTINIPKELIGGEAQR